MNRADKVVLKPTLKMSKSKTCKIWEKWKNEEQLMKI